MTDLLRNSQLIRRFKALWWLKGPGIGLFMYLFFQVYFHLLQHPRVQVTEMPLLPLDGQVPFHPVAWLFYLSLWFYTVAPVALLPSLGQLLHYGFWIGLLCSLGLLCFYVWPSRVPLALAWPTGSEWNLLDGLDAAGNACPSLHVAACVFSAAWLQRQISELHLSRALVWLNPWWAVAIIWSTLATRQHVLLDVLAGLLLGGLLAYVSLRSSRHWLGARRL